MGGKSVFFLKIQLIHRDRPKDPSSTPITSKLNIEPSVNILPTVYRMPTDLLMSKLRVWGEKGGKVLFVPPDRFSFHQMNSNHSREKYPFSLAIFQEDNLYPVCPTGLVRSQILYLALKGN